VEIVQRPQVPYFTDHLPLNMGKPSWVVNPPGRLPGRRSKMQP
jgi:hypothetical protein